MTDFEIIAFLKLSFSPCKLLHRTDFQASIAPYTFFSIHFRVLKPFLVFYHRYRRSRANSITRRTSTTFFFSAKKYRQFPFHYFATNFLFIFPSLRLALAIIPFLPYLPAIYPKSLEENLFQNRSLPAGFGNGSFNGVCILSSMRVFSNQSHFLSH